MDVKLPKLGEGADSGVVVNVFVKEGDTIAKDQAILELENEKAVASIPSTGAGVVSKVHVKAGDRVLFGKWSGTEIRLDGEELMIMKESDVMGIVEGATAAAKTS